ncbi:hypothetical protein Tco_1467894 [Tanacetum coccineum]
MKRYIEIVNDDEVAIDAIPLATKPPVIVEYKIDKDGRIGYFKLIRADGSSKRLESLDSVKRISKVLVSQERLGNGESSIHWLTLEGFLRDPAIFPTKTRIEVDNVTYMRVVPRNSREYGTYCGCGGWFATVGESLEEYGVETLICVPFPTLQ